MHVSLNSRKKTDSIRSSWMHGSLKRPNLQCEEQLRGMYGTLATILSYLGFITLSTLKYLEHYCITKKTDLHPRPRSVVL